MIMNIWVERSVALANETDYLDRLEEIYPVPINPIRTVSDETKNILRTAYDGKDDRMLLKLLLESDKFPIKDTYVAFLRKKKGTFIDLNPKTVQRIAQRIRSIPFEEVIEGIEEPKEANRQMGEMFGTWVPKIGLPLLKLDDFKKFGGRIAILNENDNVLRRFADDVLGCALEKNPDFIAKAFEKYIVGEAKFLTDSGGHQINQFRDALTLLNGQKGAAIRIAILDGVVWIRGRSDMYKTILKQSNNALSALLLKDFLNSIGDG